jgi:hypothetical protein
MILMSVFESIKRVYLSRGFNSGALQRGQRKAVTGILGLLHAKPRVQKRATANHELFSSSQNVNNCMGT